MFRLLRGKPFLVLAALGGWWCWLSRLDRRSTGATAWALTASTTTFTTIAARKVLTPSGKAASKIEKNVITS